MAEYLTNTTDLTKVASAIREKGGTSDQLVYPDGFVTAIQAIQTGGGTKPGAPGDITFYDYDGTIVTSWTLEELVTKTALPDYPSHEGLTCQGWNWSLADLKTTNRKMNVGAMYITDDGATRLHIRIATVGRMTVPLYIGQTVANGVSIDWGDGSTAETLSGTGKVNTSHTYAEPGDYIISLMPDDGCTLSFGSNSNAYCIMGSAGDNGRVYCNMLQEVYVGKNVTTIRGYAFQYCYSLSSITIPDGITYISSSAFAYCYSLASITIPNGVTSISGSAFQACYSLVSITIPNGVTSIGSSAFSDCYGMRYYDFSACTSVPALSNTNAFNNIPSDCQMLIPAALYDEWSAATNWAIYADHIVGV